MDGVFWRWWIDPDDLRLTPAACVAAPAAGLTLTGQVVDLRSLATNFNGFSAVALIGRHEPDAAVAVLVVVPVHERQYPGAGLLHAAEWASGVVRPILDRAEQRLRVGVVVADPRP